MFKACLYHAKNVSGHICVSWRYQICHCFHNFCTSELCTSSVTKTKNMNNVFNKNKLELHVHNATTDSDR